MDMHVPGNVNREEIDDPEVRLLLNEIEHVRTRLTATGAGNDRSAAVSALLDAVDSHARVRRLAVQLLDGNALMAVTRELEALWAQILSRAPSSP